MSQLWHLVLWQSSSKGGLGRTQLDRNPFLLVSHRKGLERKKKVTEAVEALRSPGALLMIEQHTTSFDKRFAELNGCFSSGTQSIIRIAQVRSPKKKEKRNPTQGLGHCDGWQQLKRKSLENSLQTAVLERSLRAKSILNEKNEVSKENF